VSYDIVSFPGAGQSNGAPQSVPLFGVTANHFSPELVVAVAVKGTSSSPTGSTDNPRSCGAGGVAPFIQVTSIWVELAESVSGEGRMGASDMKV
jgi:hypothetical protein